MNNGLRKRLNQLIGKNMDVIFDHGFCYITIPGPSESLHGYTLLKIEEDDCLVLQEIGFSKSIKIVSIEKIAYITIR